MSHYEERLEHDLDEIRNRVVELGQSVEEALRSGIRALLEGDRRLANETALGDLAINRATRALDRLCHAFVARHLPSAGHLRFISAVLRLTVALERVGDYAVNFCREALQLSAPPQGTVARDIELMAHQCDGLLHESVKAFHDGSAEQARATLALARQVGTTFEKVFEDLLQQGEEDGRPLRDLFALLVVFNRLERVGDQAKNICEDTVFAVTGEMKASKVYRVLFVDEGDAGVSQMAAAYAAKAYPESGRYASAGWKLADSVDHRLVTFLEERGVDLQGARPSLLSRSLEQLSDYHVIVDLGGDLPSHVDRLPFHTIVLSWEIEPAPASDAEEGATREAFEAQYRQVAARTRELMEALRGEEAL